MMYFAIRLKNFYEIELSSIFALRMGSNAQRSIKFCMKSVTPKTSLKTMLPYLLIIYSRLKESEKFKDAKI